MNARTAFTFAIIACLFASYMAFPVAPVAADGTGTIIIDYSHGQESSYVTALDNNLAGNLTDMGYTCVFAKGGLNSSILGDADGLIIGSVLNSEFTGAEINAIGAWYGTGKFLWVGYDSDYGGADYIRTNMTAVLKKVGSHVYGEPTSVEDAISNCVQPYRVVATHSPYVAGVDAVLMHGPTLVYGSTTADPAADTVALETTSIPNVYPILKYNESAYITDADLVPPIAHTNNQEGAFVAATYEMLDGGVVVVSGASPYGDYQPMCADEYYDVPLQGMTFVTTIIDGGMNNNLIPADMTMILLIGGIGVVVIVIIVAVIFMRKK